ncbi:CG6678 [Drosophila busckii]|uniref:CG6678 n=1 Tax=Drosophila busckii TaxID=30019 RepID=A0A0M3QYC7_DROBS|nr:RCC1 domain-containing protein 1 [Drosophila busckii]ALC47389.1 CG6678 [Drosophila busckii]
MRQLLFTGFNAFGQHNENNKSSGRTSARVNGFTEIVEPGNNDDSQLIVALSWRYTAYALGSKLWLRGLLNCEPIECLELEAPAAVRALAACDQHCLVLLQTGALFKLLPKLGANLQSILLETAASTTTGTKRNIFGQAKTETANVITHIACGSHINVAVSAANAVYSIPSFLHQFPQRQWRVQQLTCGNEHALLLNGNGDVHAWGSGLRGQLGQQTLSVEETPQLVEALAGIKITHIAAGAWHSAAISAFGDLYTWGYNSNGQLGMRVMKRDSLLKEPAVYPLPQLHDLPACCAQLEDDAAAAADEACAPLKVFCGARHTLIMRRCGRLWACGWCAHGQLGTHISQLNYLDAFEAVNDVCKDESYDVICGPWATILMCM